VRALAATELRAAIKEINAKVSGAHADPFAAANKGLLKKLAATLNEEYMGALRQQAPAAAAKLEEANRVYADGIGKINSTFGKQITKFAREKEYDKVARAFANPKVSVDDIPRILEVAGQDGAEAVRVTVLADIVARAKKGGDNITPEGLSRAMNTWGEERLAALLSPEQLAKLNDLATASSAMARSQKVIHGSPTAEKARMLAYPSAIGGAVLGHPVLLAGIVGEAAFNRFASSSAGQRWLTTGFPLATNLVRGTVSAGTGATGASIAGPVR
jgi:hypothetical protein